MFDAKKTGALAHARRDRKLTPRIDDLLVVRQRVVQETLQGAGFLHGHRELRGRRRVETALFSAGRDCYGVASCLLARAVTIDPESESACLVLLAVISVVHAFSLFYFRMREGSLSPSTFIL